MLERLDQAAIAGKLPMDHIDALLPALFDIAEPLPNQMGFGAQMPFISCWRSASWYLKMERNQETRGQIFLRALRDARGLAVPGTLIGLDMDRRSKGDRELMLTDDQLDAAKIAWVEKLKVALNEDPDTMIPSVHIISFLYQWREFEESAAPRAWVASVVSQPRLLPILLQAFVHEGQAHTMGDFVSHKMVSFRLDALLPFVELPEMLDAVRALPAEIDETRREARDRFIEVAGSHIAKLKKASETKQQEPEESGPFDHAQVDED
jgi:hypothetical protein